MKSDQNLKFSIVSLKYTKNICFIINTIIILKNISNTLTHACY